MKLEFDCIQDFYELSELVVAGRQTLDAIRYPKRGEVSQVVTVTGKVTEVTEAIRAQYGPTLTAAQAAMLAATAVSESSLADEPESERSSAEAVQSDKDADGAPYNTEWHSDPAKVTAKGVWRARRGRDEAAYKAWLLEQAVEVAEAAIAADDAEPVATETHALPHAVDRMVVDVDVADDGTATVSEPRDVPLVDHAALIEASQEAAKDAPDGTIDLLNAGKVFISEYGTAKFEALKAAVSPLEDGKGKPIPSLTPGERRLLRACMDNYALYL